MAGIPTLRVIREHMIEIRCDECGRFGRYRRQTLARLYGWDAPMPTVLLRVAESCPRSRNTYYNRCRAYFVDSESRPSGGRQTP